MRLFTGVCARPCVLLLGGMVLALALVQRAARRLPRLLAIVIEAMALFSLWLFAVGSGKTAAPPEHACFRL